MNFEKEIEENLMPMVQEIANQCKIDSVEAAPLEGMPFGEGAAKALQAFLKAGEDMGFKTENFENYVGHIDFGDQEDMIGILGHVDVVPVGEGWEVDPFGGVIKDGAVWGRGTMDDKGPMMVCLYAMKILKEKGVKLSKKIRMIVGTNEETNWGCMNYYLNTVKPKYPVASFSPDASFPVTYAEKGIYQYELVKNIDTKVEINGGNAFNAVPSIAEAYVPGVQKEAVEKAAAELTFGCTFEVSEEREGVKIISHGVGCHAAELHDGINAVSGLMELLSKLGLEGEFAQFLNVYEKYIGTTIFAEKVGLASEDESGHQTLNIGKLTLKDGRVSVCCDMRIPVTNKIEPVIARIKEIAAAEGMEYIEGSTEAPLYIPKDSELVQTLMQTYIDVTGDTNAQPITAGGGTYSRCLNNCVAFGTMLPHQVDRMHQANERVDIADLKTSLEIMCEAIYRLAK